MKRFALLTITLCTLSIPLQTFAQEATLITDVVTMQKARVITILTTATSTLPGTETTRTTQTLTVEVLEGAELGKKITLENDYLPLAVGEVFYLRHTTNDFDHTDMYAVAEPYRLPILAALTAFFLVLLFLFGGLQGVRGLLALGGSILLILYALIPGILYGLPPAPVAILVASTIIVLGSYITHGFNKTTSAAVLGMLGHILITGIGAYLIIHMSHVSGYSSDETIYLNFDLRGGLDAVGLLYAGIMIGLLGVLYDIAIGQAIAVEELFAAGKHLTRRQVYKRGIRIGREHIGALVNTLAIAYVGAALPLLLLVQSSTFGLAYMLNSELFTTEIIRILVGAIGLILAVPITTYIATYMLQKQANSGTLDKRDAKKNAKHDEDDRAAG